MAPWKPLNYEGTIYYDPRDEVGARASNAARCGDGALAISVSLARALADLRECDSTTVLTGDEDGPLPPMTVRCRKPVAHDGMHFNGSASWRP